MININNINNTLCKDIEYKYIKYIYAIIHKNNIYNLLLLRNKRINYIFKDLGLNKNINFLNIFIKKRFMFNIYLDALLYRRYLFTKLSIKYNKDKYKHILQFIKSYKFYRIIAKLPVNGQNTHSNHRTYRKLSELYPIYKQTLSLKKKNEKKKRKKSRK